MTQSHQSGSVADDRSLSRAMFLYGFAMFMLVYMVQPLLPRFVAEFSVAPAIASQALSAATLGMAVFLIPASLYAGRFRRKRLLVTGLILCSLLSLAVVLTHDFRQFVGLRLLFGIVLSALPATALAYLAETVEATHLGRAVGLYIAGNAMGGMSGRLLTLSLSEWLDWRQALAALGLLALLIALHLARVLPTDTPSTEKSIKRGLATRLHRLLSDPAQLALFALAFLLSGSIVSIYNYISFRLAAPPYGFGFVALSGIYALYLVGMLGSARAGRLADRFGRGPVLVWLPVIMMSGLLLTCSSHIVPMISGIAVMTFGFFAGHSVASGWVSAWAHTDRSLASSLYLTMYYLGASVLGTVAGDAWARFEWTGVVWLNSATLTVALLLAIALRRVGQAAAAFPES